MTKGVGVLEGSKVSLWGVSKLGETVSDSIEGLKEAAKSIISGDKRLGSAGWLSEFSEGAVK